MLTTTSAVATAMHVLEDGEFVGEVLLDDQDRVVLAGTNIPKDVVLKAIVAYTRCNEEAGSVRSRRNRRLYSWQVLGLD